MIIINAIRKNGIVALLSAILFIICSSSSLNYSVDQIPALLTRFGQKFPNEKVHLHLDRDYFIAGDTLNFKAYVVNAQNNQLSDLSNALYIDLVNTANGSKSSLYIQLKDGSANGNIELPDTLKTGIYTLRAYTSWMHNFESSFFYQTSLKIVGNDFQKTFQSKVHHTVHSIQFFPEGGNLVNGLISVIGFKAVNEDGKGEATSGSIVDESGAVLTTFHSAFAGMGRFTIKPLPAHRYQAVVTYMDGTVQKVSIPQAANEGYVLMATNMDKNQVTIQVNYNGKHRTNSVWLLAQANNKLISFTEVSLINNVATISVQRNQLSNGIVQFTLFDEQATPVAERLIFNDLNRQLRVNVSLLQNASANLPAKVTLEVTDELLNPVKGNFSVAITDQSMPASNSAKSSSILADLLLTSDLKGTIENPDHYFAYRLPETVLLLDNLLLTQGWRRFIWKDLLNSKDPLIKYPTTLNPSLNGTVLTDKGLPMQNAKVMLISKGQPAFTLDTLTDNKGKFSFNLPELFGRQEFTIIASTAASTKNINVIVDEDLLAKPINLPVTSNRSNNIDSNLFSSLDVKRQSALHNLSVTSAGRQLKEVVVSSKKIGITDKAVAASQNLNGAGNADQIISYKDLTNCTDLEMCLQGKLAGIFFKTVKDPNSNVYKRVAFLVSGMDKPMLIVLDGVAIPPDQASLSNTPPQNVQTIEILRSGSKLAVYGGQGSGGVLIITTKAGEINYDQLNTSSTKAKSNIQGVLHIVYNGYHQSRQFYQQPFNASDTQQNGTIFWQPNITTNDEGKATIEFKAGTNVRKVAITVEGLSNDGKIAYKYQTQSIR